MKPGARGVRLLALVILTGGLLALFWRGVPNLRANETTGLEYVGAAGSSPDSSDPPNLSPAERTAYRYFESLFPFGEPPLGRIAAAPGVEAYRLCYRPSFNPNVCVTIWQEAGRSWLRTSVTRWDENRNTYLLWHKTQPLSTRNWNRLRAAFQKRSVTDPLNGEDRSGGIDGSSWYLESSTGGRSALTRIDNPVRSRGLPHFQFVTEAEPRLRDFVKTSLLFLDTAGVRVPEMY